MRYGLSSIYEGDTAGQMYADRLAERRRAEQLKRDQIRAGLQEAAMREQAQIAAAQQHGISTEPPREQTNVPEQQQESAGRRGGLQQEHHDLASYIQGVAMGNPLAAEKGFGMAQPGSTRRNADGSISFNSPEGHPVTIPKDHVDMIMGGYKMRAPTVTDPLTQKAKETTIALNEARLAGIGKEKPMNEKEKAELEHYKQSGLSQYRKERRDVIADLEDAQIKYKDALLEVDKYSKEGGKAYNDAQITAGLYKQRLARLNNEMAELDKSSPQTFGIQKQPVAEQTTEQGQPQPAPQQTPVQQTPKTPIDRYNIPAYGFKTMQDAINANLPKGTILTIDGRKAIVE